MLAFYRDNDLLLKVYLQQSDLEVIITDSKPITCPKNWFSIWSALPFEASLLNAIKSSLSRNGHTFNKELLTITTRGLS